MEDCFGRGIAARVGVSQEEVRAAVFWEPQRNRRLHVPNRGFLSCSRAAKVPRDGARPPVSPAFSCIVPGLQYQACATRWEENNNNYSRDKFEFRMNSFS